MTLAELSTLYYLNKLIERDTRELAKLENSLQLGSANMNGMPRNPSPKNLIEEVAPLIVDIKERIQREKEEFLKERMAIEGFIRSVEDYQIRLILSYRFIDLLTWNQVAAMIGGNNTEDSVKKMCYRFLKQSEKRKVVPNVPYTCGNVVP